MPGPTSWSSAFSASSSTGYTCSSMNASIRPRSSSTRGEGEKSMARQTTLAMEQEREDDPVHVKLAKRARVQAAWCTRLGSPLYGELVGRVADDVESGGPFDALMTDPAADPLGDVPMLRLMGAAHRLALEGRAPDLARTFPSTGGRADPDAAWHALLALARDEPELL